MQAFCPEILAAWEVNSPDEDLALKVLKLLYLLLECDVEKEAEGVEWNRLVLVPSLVQSVCRGGGGGPVLFSLLQSALKQEKSDYCSASFDMKLHLSTALRVIRLLCFYVQEQREQRLPVVEWSSLIAGAILRHADDVRLSQFASRVLARVDGGVPVPASAVVGGEM